jgi:hypothetical protein
MAENAPSYSSSLNRRYRTAAATINAFIVVTIVLTVAGYFGRAVLFRPGDLLTVALLRIAILIFAIGAVVLRRTKFQAMRLQDIAALYGIEGLLKTLEGTTVQVGIIALAIVLMGFAGTVLSSDYWQVVTAGVVALVLLVYCYPRKRAWERVIEGIELYGDANDEPTGEVKA